MTINVVIVGGGRVGAHLASLLLKSGHSVKVIELRQEHAEALKRLLPEDTVIHGNATDPVVLEDAQVSHSDVLAAVTGSDETNLVSTSLGRFEFGVPRTIARVKDPRNAWMFTPVMGVDVAVNQADLMAHLVAEGMTLDKMMTLLKFTRGQFSLVEEKVHSHSRAAGKALRDLNLPVQCLMTGLIREGEFLLPRGDTVLLPDDEVLAVIQSTELAELAAILGPSAA